VLADAAQAQDLNPQLRWRPPEADLEFEDSMQQSGGA
jgi:hypothetical protein